MLGFRPQRRRRNFDEVKEELKQRIYPKFRRYILGDTDRGDFRLFLSRLSDFGLIDRHPRVEYVVDALADAVSWLGRLRID